MPQIKLTQPYRGRPTRNQIIQPGVYTLDDERLLGVGQYLLDQGFAALVEDVEPRNPQLRQPWTGEIPSITTAPNPLSEQLPAEAVITPPPVINYAEMDMELLRAEIAKRDLNATIVGTGKNGAVLKVDLITALKAADAETSE